MRHWWYLWPPALGPHLPNTSKVFKLLQVWVKFTKYKTFVLCCLGLWTSISNLPHTFPFFPSSRSMLSPLYQELGGLVVCPHTSSSSSQGIRRPPRCHPPPISGSSVGPNPTYYHTVYDIQVDQYADVPFPVGGGGYGARFGRKPLSLVTNDSTVPPIRRRGGLVDHRDVILAHQAHKLHNTPQARRKQWEWVRPNLRILWFSSI